MKKFICFITIILLYVSSYAMGILHDYHPHTLFISTLINDDLYSNYENEAYDKYTVDDIVFIPEMDNTTLTKENLENDNVAVNFELMAFTKNPENISFIVTDVNVIVEQEKLNSSDLTKSIYSLEDFSTTFHYNDVINLYSSATCRTHMIFPRPKDMKFSLEIEFELTNNGEKSVHTYIYDYKIKAQNKLFRYVGP